MSTRRIPMMTEDEIQTELGWIRPMIYSLLDAPDSDRACRLYRRERVLAVAQSPEGQAAKRRWDATFMWFHPEHRLDLTPWRYWTSIGHHSGRCREDAGATRIPIQQVRHRQRHGGRLRCPAMEWLYHAERLASCSRSGGHQIRSPRSREAVSFKRASG
jgi:hypothetical protein